MAKKAAKKAVKKTSGKVARTKAPARKRKPADPVSELQQQPKIRVTVTSPDYERKKEAAAEREREIARKGRDIGAIPAPEDPARREACREDFGRFCKTYFAETFRHDWSPVHRRLIDLIQMVVLIGALLAMGIPRGWGKTSLSVRGVLWAVAYRHHTFVMLIGASNDAAKQLIMDIRTELESNALLRADFPELCTPIAALEGINQRGKAQLCCGERTRVFASDYELRLGDVNGQHGGIIRSGGILSSKIRGARHVAEGRVVRPTLGLVDDPQTEASAASRRGNYRRERVIQAALPGLPGAGEAWSCLMTMTVIEPDDVADRVLCRERHPEWHGVRHSALEGMPNDEAMEHWYSWNKLREESLRRDQDLSAAHKYYRRHKKAMQAGVQVVWKDGYDPEQFLDPLEQSMDWFFRDRQGFWSELMNNPAGFALEGRPVLDRDTVARRTHHLPWESAPLQAEFVTAFADVQGKCLWWEVRAWASDSTSWILAYGTWPAQPRPYYTLSDLKLTLDSAYPKHATLEARITVAIKDLFASLFAKEWAREDGQILRLNVAGVDANWQTEVVKRAVRASGLSGRLIPTHGRSFRPPKMSINDLQLKDGDRAGEFWRLRSPRDKDSIRHFLYDVDHWKTFHRDRLLIPVESAGSVTLPKGRDHTMYADHMMAESSSILHDVTSQRTVEVWEHRPERPDNHLLDCAVGNSMLGAMLGCKLPDAVSGQQAPKRRKAVRRKRGGKIW